MEIKNNSKQQSVLYSKKDIECKIVVSTFFSILFAILLIILLITSGYLYARQRPKMLTYTYGICQVQNFSYRPYSCSSHYSLDECYLLQWNVIYGENQTIISTIVEHNLNVLSNILERGKKYQIKSSYLCWYNTKNPLEVQWNQPDMRTTNNLFICSGLTMIFMLISIYIAIKYCKLEKQQRRIVWTRESVV